MGKEGWLEMGVLAVVGQRRSSMMPFTLEELVVLSRCLRDACLGIIKLAYPETKPEVREEYITAFQSIGVTTSAEMQQCIQLEQKRWIQLFKVCVCGCALFPEVEEAQVCFGLIDFRRIEIQVCSRHTF